MPFARLEKIAPVLSLAGLLAVGAVVSGCDSEEAANPDSDALLVLTSPQGGETFTVGQTIQVKWETPKVDPARPVDLMNVQFSWDNGQRWASLPEQAIPKGSTAWGNFSWTIPDSIRYGGLRIRVVDSTRCLLRVLDYNAVDSSQRATLPKTFTIRAATP